MVRDNLSFVYSLTLLMEYYDENNKYSMYISLSVTNNYYVDFQTICTQCDNYLCIFNWLVKIGVFIDLFLIIFF
jgi:hypothetical protein